MIMTKPKPEDFAYSNLLTYSKSMMPSYIVNNHHKLMAHYLQKLERGDITRLAIFMPPRMGKTKLASQDFSSWYLGRNPTHEVVFSSYSQDRADDVGKAIRDDMLTETYEHIFPPSALKSDAKGSRKFQTVSGGWLYAVGWGGPLTGRGANCNSYGTVIETEAGPVKIEDLHANNSPPRVLSLDFLGQPCYTSIIKSIKIEGIKTYEIRTKSGRILSATSDHRVYSRTRGFIRFRDIKVGEELVCNGRQQKKKSRQIFNPKMLFMQKKVCSCECGCSKIHKKRIQGCLLFSEMLSCGSCCKKQSKMLDVQRRIEINEIRKKIKSDLLQRMSSKTNMGDKETRAAVQRMWDYVSTDWIEDNFLQQRMFFKKLCKSFSKKQQEVLFNIISKISSNYFRTGQPLLCNLCNKRSDENISKREISYKSGHSSSRYKSEEQQSREFGDSLSPLPFSSSSFETDVVSMAPRLSSYSESVYDLKVKTTHNYFAEGILNHNCLILDDLIKDRADSQSKINRRKREEWFSSTAYTRLMVDENGIEGRVLLIMTRWAYDDIAAYLLNDLAHENWNIINLPAIAEGKDALGRKEGEPLWPAKQNLKRLETIKKSVPADDWSSLYQQRPLPKEGGLLKFNWFNSYDQHELRFIEDTARDGKPLPEKHQWFSKIVLSLDTAYKANQINDPSAISAWGYNKNRQYLLESVGQRLEFPQLKKWVIDMRKKYLGWNMGPVPILIEDAASGQSLIQVLRQETGIPIIAVQPDKSKIIRAELVSDYIESGRVYLPERAPWLSDYQTEIVQFPYGPLDNQVDSTTQYLRWVFKPKKIKRPGKLFFK